MNIKNFAALGFLLFSHLTHAQLYLGVAPGAVIEDVTLTANHISLTTFEGACNTSGGFATFAPSALIGYAQEFTFGGVVGVEFDFTYHPSHTAPLICQCPTTPSVADSFSFYSQMQGSLRARFGYAFVDRSLLVFVSGGGAMAKSGLSYSNENADQYETNAVVPGWLVGGGLEWRSDLELSFRVEYHYAAYNDVNVPMPRIYGLIDPSGAAHASSRSHNVRLATNFWFW